MRGWFVVLEGGDRSGKSLQAARLVAWLNGRGKRCILTREPGGTPVGRRIRELLLDPRVEMTMRTEALLYAADRAEHVATVIRPALERGDIVVSDRYVESSLVYQGDAGGVDVEYLTAVNRLATGGLEPDLLIVLDAERHALAGREREVRDRIEERSGDYHDRVRRAYRKLVALRGERAVLVDAGRSVDEVEQAIREAVLAHEQRRGWR